VLILHRVVLSPCHLLREDSERWKSSAFQPARSKDTFIWEKRALRGKC